MAGAAVTGYNLRHLQVAPKTETPTYKDINYATTFEFPISQDSETLRADGSAAVTAQGAPEGGGSIGFASIDLATMAVMTGGSTSETGTAGTRITRLEVESTYSPPAWSEMSSDLSFVGDENEVMLIWEELATAPTFTSGVIPTNLEPPA